MLVLRHENEISGTTDVAAHPEFHARRTTKEIDGKKLTGWFTEDFTWAELATLRARERIPKVRPANASFDDRFPLLRLTDLFSADRGDGCRRRPPLGMVAEIKHASYFAGIGLPLDELFAAELAAAGWATDDERLTVEAFEITVLEELALRGHHGASGVPAGEGRDAPGTCISAPVPMRRGYADFLTDTGLRELEGRVDGISVDKTVLVAELALGRPGRAARGLERHRRGDRARSSTRPTTTASPCSPGRCGPRTASSSSSFQHGHGKADPRRLAGGVHAWCSAPASTASSSTTPTSGSRRGSAPAAERARFGADSVRASANGRGAGLRCRRPRLQLRQP